MTEALTAQEIAAIKILLDRFMVKSEVAKELKVSEATLSRWIREGSFPAGKNGRWLRSEVIEWGKEK